MNPDQALKTVNSMKKWAIKQDLSLLIVGSVGYRSALFHTECLEECDDLDCILIYDDIRQIAGCPIVDDSFYQLVCRTIDHQADMFTVKSEQNGIRLSVDFVSGKYLHVIANEEITGESKFRLKLTNAVEVPDNVYCNFYGEQTTYHKTWIPYQEYRIYKLPIHYFVGDTFFPGVLFSKYIFNPTLVVICEHHKQDINAIQKRIKDYCPADGSLCRAYYKASAFSAETKAFLEER